MRQVKSFNVRSRLNHWAVLHGYNDFDTYIRLGGSILEVHDSLMAERDAIDFTLACLDDVYPERETPERQPELPVIGEEALARAEAETVGDEPPHAENAHPQGADA